MKLNILIAFVFVFIAQSDTAVLFSSDFEMLPDGWMNDGWDFGCPGANFTDYVMFYTPSEARFSSYECSSPILYFVPDGTDSLEVHVEHDLFVNGDHFHAMISCWSTTLGLDTFYDVELYYQYPFEDPDPIRYVIFSPPTGTYVGFDFYVIVTAGYMGETYIDWTIISLTVTAFGDGLELDSQTWGSLKSTFDTL